MTDRPVPGRCSQAKMIGVLPQRLPADRLHADRGLQAAAARRTAASTSGRWAPAPVGDDAFSALVQNLQDSFALTAWQLVPEGQPFTDVLTTKQFMMTTGAQEPLHPDRDAERPAVPFGNAARDQAGVDGRLRAATAIPLEQTLIRRPNYMVFDDEAPATAGAASAAADLPRRRRRSAQADVHRARRSCSSACSGSRRASRSSASPTCCEHASKPYFTTGDLTDWQWVTISHKATRDGRRRRSQPYDLPTLRDGDRR